MISNLEAAKLYKFISSQAADGLVLTLNGNIAVQRNIRNVKDFYESIIAIEAKQRQPSAEFMEYERKRNQYIEEYAERDAEGNKIQTQGGVKLADVAGFQKDMEVLMLTCKPALDEHQQKIQDWEEYLRSEYEGKISMIDISDVKFSELSKSDFEAFNVMIKKPEEAETAESGESEKEAELITD